MIVIAGVRADGGRDVTLVITPAEADRLKECEETMVLPAEAFLSGMDFRTDRLFIRCCPSREALLGEIHGLGIPITGDLPPCDDN